MKKKMPVVLIVIAILTLTQRVFAGSAEAEIEEVAIDHAPKYDLRVKVRWTGSGDQFEGDTSWLQVQHAHFGHEGVNRIESLVIAALLSGKTIWFNFTEDRGKNYVRSVYLKANRN